MAKKPLSYWQRRASERLVDSEALGTVAVAKLQRIYDQALKNLDKEIKSIYDNYADKGILDVKELKKALGEDGAREFLKKVEVNARKLGLKPSEIYDERYLSRLSRLQALQEQIKLEVMTIAPQEETLTTDHYTRVIDTAYKSFQSDFSLMGYTPSFTTLDKKVVDVMLKSVWVGDNYSNRIWGNTEKLAARLPTIMGAALLSGQAQEKTARQLRERFDVSRYEALRLVRTETAYFHNETEAQSYIDDGLERYTLDITLDGKTSKICLAINESTIYYFKDRVVGKNWPPLHTFCRTVPRALLDGEKPPKDLRFEDRIKRFQTVKQEDLLKERYKKAMQDQMNPNKAVYDYNAEMNTITQNLSKKIITQQQFNEQLNDLMSRIPGDYPLRGGLETIAKLNGWKKPDFDANQLQVQKMLKQATLDEANVAFDPKQAKFIIDNKIKFNNARTGTDDIGGAYNQDTKTISIDAANLKAMSNEFQNPKYIDKVLKHELGHAVDVSRTSEYSQTPDFNKIIKKNNRFSDEALKISQYRMAEGITDKDFSKSFKDMTPIVYQDMAETGEAIYIGERSAKVPREVFNYHMQNDELFAEAYALYHVNPRWMQENTPELLQYFNILLN